MLTIAMIVCMSVGTSVLGKAQILEVERAKSDISRAGDNESLPSSVVKYACSTPPRTQTLHFHKRNHCAAHFTLFPAATHQSWGRCNVPNFLK